MFEFSLPHRFLAADRRGAASGFALERFEAEPRVGRHSPAGCCAVDLGNLRVEGISRGLSRPKSRVVAFK